MSDEIARLVSRIVTDDLLHDRLLSTYDVDEQVSILVREGWAPDERVAEEALAHLITDDLDLPLEEFTLP